MQWLAERGGDGDDECIDIARHTLEIALHIAAALGRTGASKG